MARSQDNSSSQQSESANSNPEATDSLEELITLLRDLGLAREDLNKFSTSSKQPAKQQPQSNLSPPPPEDPNLLSLHQTVVELKEKLERLENQVYEPTDLINPLLPLITELLNLRSIESQESLLKSLIPIIDEAIKQRSGQDFQKMGEAIAPVLPTAIAHEIENSPTEIAKAIAPEMAIAIQEQIRLDPDAIATTLGPQMGEAIKNQIKVEQNAMVDALYPVIGSTISKYMVELVKSINEKVESALSFEGIKRKIRAKLQGVSEAELILQEAINYEVQAVFLIHKASGLVIRELHPSLELRLEADMLAGLLTAIRSFVNECIVQPGEVSELNQIEYDASTIVLEVAGYCYIAAVIRGSPSKRYMQKLRKTLGKIVLKYGKLIAAYDGDPAAIPNSIEPLLEKLTRTEAQEKASKPPYALLAILGAIIFFWGFVLYRGSVANRIEAKTSEALDAAPELSIYRISSEMHGGKLTLAGRVPNQDLKDKAGKIASQVAPNLKIDNQIIAVEVPADPVLTAGEIERVAWIFNQKEGVAITAHHDYNTKTVTVEGIVPDRSAAEQITQVFKNIPGVETVTNTVQIRPILETRIYFESGSTKYSSPDTADRLRAIRLFLDRNPGVHLRIIGHTDDTGDRPKNQDLGIQRARLVQQALIAEQIEPSRLHVSGSAELPPGVTPDRPLWLSRCVRFEVFIPSPGDR
ncbi:MAG: BON domain-containing protein [Hydrococcus sp. C42_A2020_068]|nr:BON domain-containing protein [Hydrococcus sp. C42_A2020_068]